MCPGLADVAPASPCFGVKLQVVASHHPWRLNSCPFRDKCQGPGFHHDGHGTQCPSITPPDKRFACRDRECMIAPSSLQRPDASNQPARPLARSETPPAVTTPPAVKNTCLSPTCACLQSAPVYPALDSLCHIWTAPEPWLPAAPIHTSEDPSSQSVHPMGLQRTPSQIPHFACLCKSYHRLKSAHQRTHNTLLTPAHTLLQALSCDHGC